MGRRGWTERLPGSRIHGLRGAEHVECAPPTSHRERSERPSVRGRLAAADDGGRDPRFEQPRHHTPIGERQHGYSRGQTQVIRGGALEAAARGHHHTIERPTLGRAWVVSCQPRRSTRSRTWSRVGVHSTHLLAKQAASGFGFEASSRRFVRPGHRSTGIADHFRSQVRPMHAVRGVDGGPWQTRRSPAGWPGFGLITEA